jgi:hypothetical protein
MRQLLRLKHRDAGITLLNAMSDPALFGSWFKNQATWRAWGAFLKALFGLRMTLPERILFRRHTGRTTPPKKQAREGWLVVGRRGGKSFVCALVGVFLACFRDYSAYLSPGERGVLMILASDRRQARVLMRYVTALLEGVPMLARMIQRIGAESIDLTNSITIEIHTASFRSTRGYTVIGAILDEISFWRSEDSANPDHEIVGALLPAMSTIPNALLLGISSPYSRRGILWDKYQEHFGHDNADVLVWQADSRSMNPTLSKAVVDQAFEDDPASAAAEYGAQFRTDVEAFLAGEIIGAATQEGVHERKPQPDTTYRAWTDPSGGRHDSFTLSIAHSENGRLILDVCRARRPPFSPQSVIAEFAALLKSYGLSRVTGDRYGAEFVVSAYQSNGITYDASERSTSDVYLEVLPHFSQGVIQLLDNRVLLNELRQLERRVGATKDSVTHPPRGHDDSACSACGALLLSVRAMPMDVQKHSYVSDAAELRADRDDHMISDLGYLGDATIEKDSPFSPEWKDLP